MTVFFFPLDIMPRFIHVVTEFLKTDISLYTYTHTHIHIYTHTHMYTKVDYKEETVCLINNDHRVSTRFEISV